MNKLETEIYTACANNDIKSVLNLIDKVNIDFTDNDGETLLNMAACAGYADIAKLLIAKGANINSCNKSGDTALMLASRGNHGSIVELLLDSDLDAQDRDGCTALSLTRDCYVVNLLINQGANVNIQSKHGLNLLMLASASGYIDIVELLIERNANLDLKNAAGGTALMIAAFNGHIDIIELLIKNGVDVYIEDKDCDTVFDIAVEDNNDKMISLLTSKFVNHKDRSGNTHLMRSCENKNEKTVLHLYDIGVDFFENNKVGDSAYKILKRKRKLSPGLMALKEKLVLEQMSSQISEQTIGL